MYSLTIKERDTKISPKSLREQDIIPGVIYGQGKDAVAVSFDRIEFIKLYRTAGESSVITLKGVGAEQDVVIKDFQLNPVSEQLMHVDFLTLVVGEALTVNVPIVYVGMSAAVDAGTGTFTSVDEVEISAMPKDLPHNITVDISVLKNVGDSIHASDLKLPAGVTAVDEDFTIASVSSIKEESEEEEVTEIDFDSIQASKEKDKDDTAE